MADAVSKLYAEIGFKVNTKQLDNAKKKIEEFANKLWAINAEANKVIGDSGKKEVKNAEENQKQILRIDKFVYRQRINNLKIYSHQATSIWRNLKKIASLPFEGTKRIWRTGQSAFQYMKPSLQEAYDFENFSFESGMKLADFQRFRQMFALSGIRMSAKDIMDDMLSAQRNLTNVALNQGGVLDAYKLTDVREAAERNDLNAVINGIMRGLQDKRIDNSMLVKLIDMFQLGHNVEWARLIRSAPQYDKDFAETFISDNERQQIKKAFEKINLAGIAFANLRDNITAKASPFMIKFSEGIKKASEIIIARIKEGDFDVVFQKLADTGEEFVEWLKKLKPEDIDTFCKNIKNAGSIIVSAAKGFLKTMGFLTKWMYTLLGTVIGAVFGSMTGGPAGAVIGAALGGATGYVFDKATNSYNATSRKDKEEWGKASYDKGYFPLDKAISAESIDDIVRESSHKPAGTTVVSYTMNNNINTTLNGMDDEEKKKEFEKIVTKTTRVNQQRDQIVMARNYNLLWVQGNTA